MNEEFESEEEIIERARELHREIFDAEGQKKQDLIEQSEEVFGISAEAKVKLPTLVKLILETNKLQEEVKADE